MALGTEARASIPSSGDIKSGDPKPVTHRVWVDPAKSVLDLCKEAGLVLRFNPSNLGEWPSEPFTHDDKGKPKTNGSINPYMVDVSDGSDTVGKTWEKAMKSAGKDRKGATLREGVALVRDHPKILDSLRLVLPGSSCGMYEVVQITKRHGKIELRPLFVGDTNSDHLKGKKKKKRLPFAVIFSSGKTLQFPNL